MNNVLENAKQIVCIVPKGLGRILVEALSTEGHLQCELQSCAWSWAFRRHG